MVLAAARSDARDNLFLFPVAVAVVVPVRRLRGFLVLVPMVVALRAPVAVVAVVQRLGLAVQSRRLRVAVAMAVVVAVVIFCSGL